jgi:hypothetical protein
MVRLERQDSTTFQALPGAGGSSSSKVPAKGEDFVSGLGRATGASVCLFIL